MRYFAQIYIICAFKIVIMRFNLAIFASGSGSNAENIINYFQNNSTISIKLIITNNPNAFVIQRAKRLNIDCIVIERSEWKDTNHTLTILNRYNIDYIILAGFLLRIPKEIIHIYPNQIINIHPALLPSYGGKGMYGDHVHKAVIEAKEKESGITIHYCNEYYDQGDIIYQARCPITPNDNYESLANKVHTLEYEYFPKVIEKLLCNNTIRF